MSLPKDGPLRKDTPPPHIRQQLVRDKGGAGDLAALPKSQRSSGFAEPASGETSVIDEVLPEDNGQSLILTHPRAARVFVRQNRSSSLSLQLTTMSQQPAKFRVASGRAEFGADGAGFKTEDAFLAGWALVLKETTDVNGRVMRGWKRRFLEVDKGELRVFNTETPNNFALGRVAQVGINLQLTPGEAVMDVLNGGRSLLRFCGSDGTIRTLAEQLMEFKLGGEKHSSANMMNTVSLLPDGGEAVLTWNGDTISTCAKSFKSVMKLEGMTIDTSEHKGINPEDRQHRLTIANCEGQSMVITVPDPLLLLQWVGAISSCDVAPEKKDVMKQAMKKLVIEETQRAPQDAPIARMHRSMSLGVGRSLGFVAGIESDNDVPSKQVIKQAMLDAPTFPAAVPSMKEMLADATMRQWVYKWSRTQFSSENVKFWAACDNLNKMEDVADKADGLRTIARDYVSTDGVYTVNISGLSRKRILKKIAETSELGDEALAALLPGILTEPIAEIGRVMEFDIHPSFALLCQEVIKERAASAADEPPPSPMPHAHMPKTGPRSVKDILADEPAMQDLVLFSTGKTQDGVLFLTLVQQFKLADGPVRLIMASHIMRDYFEVSSPRYLDGVISTKRIRLMHQEWQAAADQVVPPPSLFDAAQAEVILHVDSTIFKRYLKSVNGKPEGAVAGAMRRIPRLFAAKPAKGGGATERVSSRSAREPAASVLYVALANAYPPGLSCREGELLRLDAGADMKSKQVKATSLWTGAEGVLASSNLRPMTRDEVLAYESLCGAPVTVREPRVGLELVAGSKTPRSQPAALLPLEAGDAVVVRRVFKGTSWVEAEVNKRTGLVHLSLLRGASGNVSPVATSPRDDDKKGEGNKSPRGPRTAVDAVAVAAAVPTRGSARVMERSRDDDLTEGKLLY